MGDVRHELLAARFSFYFVHVMPGSELKVLVLRILSDQTEEILLLLLTRTIAPADDLGLMRQASRGKASPNSAKGAVKGVKSSTCRESCMVHRRLHQMHTRRELSLSLFSNSQQSLRSHLRIGCTSCSEPILVHNLPAGDRAGRVQYLLM